MFGVDFNTGEDADVDAWKVSRLLQEVSPENSKLAENPDVETGNLTVRKKDGKVFRRTLFDVNSKENLHGIVKTSCDVTAANDIG